LEPGARLSRGLPSHGAQALTAQVYLRNLTWLIPLELAAPRPHRPRKEAIVRHEVLQLDINGTPQAWISPEAAAVHYATNAVVWEEGAGPLVTLRGGWNAKAGRQSTIEVHPIIALRGAARINLHDVAPPFSADLLKRRDRHQCGFCGEHFAPRDLTVDHILPVSRGGLDSWLNCVGSCGPCNWRKADRTPEEAGMPLLFLPYVPSLFERMLLQGRNVRADVHEWLAARLPRNSRLN
jgi:hypothetical protein